MARIAIAGMLIALATAVPAAGKGWPPPTGATICGASGCRELGPEAARRIDPRTTYLTRLAPRAPAPFYCVTLRGSSPRLIYYVRTTGAIRDGVTWRKVEPKLPLEKLQPFPTPRIVRVRVDGRVARDPASYLALYSLRADPVQADPVATLSAAGDLRALWRGWIPIELESRPASPWTDASSTLWLARRGDRLVRAGQTIRVPHRLAGRIRRRLSLATV